MQITITGTSYGGTGGVGGSGSSGGSGGLSTDVATPGGTGGGVTTGSGTGGSAAATLLGIVPEESAQNFRVVPESKIQESAGIGASDITQFPRGNKKLTWTFVVERVHDSAEAAIYFALQYEAQFPFAGTLTLQTDAGELSFNNAVAIVAQIGFEGCTTTHAYRVVSGGANAGTVGGGVMAD